MESRKCIIMHGGPSNGFECIGPFDTEPDAIAYAEREGIADSWWIIPLEAPEEE